MNVLKKRLAVFFTAAAMVLNLGTITPYAEPPQWPGDVGIVAGAGIVIDADSGAVLFGQQIHVPYPPASILKLLTALVVVENCEMDEIVTFSYDAIHNLEAGAGNKLSLAEGDQISVEDCLHMMLLLSSNQSANALAEHVGGSRDGFVEMMNKKATELGCSSDETHFANPSGLNDDNQYVSAYDMALIAAAVFENQEVFRISSTKRYSVGPTINNPDGANISMEHRIVMEENQGSEYYCQGVKAGKTGYTSKAGNTLVTYAERDGRRIISVILKGSDKYQYYMDAKNIMNFGFSSFKNEPVNEAEGFLQEQEEFEFAGNTYPASRLRLEDSVITIPNGAAFSDAERSLTTDLPAGHPEAAVAMLTYTYNERKVGSAYIFDTQREEELAQEQASREAAEASREAAEALGETSAESQEEETSSASEENEKKQEKGGLFSGFSLGQNQILILAAAVGAAVVLGIGIFLGIRKKKERIEREKRRERRRQRLLEIGYNEADFEELVRKRRENGSGKGKLK